MSNPKTPIAKPKRLGHFLRDKQRESGVHQNDFVTKKLGIQGWGDQTFSKYVNGRLEHPPPGLIPALSRVYGVPVETLTVWAYQLVNSEEAPSAISPAPWRDEPPVHVIAGHTVWAASLVRAALSKEIPRFSLATFTTPQGAANLSINGLSWSSDMEDPKVTPVRSPTSTDASKDQDGPRPLSAATVAKLMEKNEPFDGASNTVFFVALPGDVIQDNPRFVRVATLLDSPGACVLVTRDDTQVRPGGPTASTQRPGMVSTDDVAEWLNRSSGARILAEAGTVARTRAEAIRTRCRNQHVGVGNLRTSELAHMSWTMLEQRNPGLWGIIAWEPQVSWFKANTEQDPSAPKLSCLPLVFTPDFGQPPHPLTFDLCAYFPGGPGGAARSVQLAPALRRLLGEVLPEVQRHAADIRRQASRGDTEALADLAEYFGLKGTTDGPDPWIGSDRICEVLVQLRFRTYPDLLGMQKAGFPLHRLAEVPLV